MAKSQGRYWQMQENFLDIFIAGSCKNATQAYRDAGYSPNGANKASSLLLTRIGIQERLAVKLKPTLEKYGISQDRVLREAAALAFTNLDEVVDYGPDHVKLRNPDEMGDMARRAAKEITMTETVRVNKDDETILTRRVTVKLESKKTGLDTITNIMGYAKGTGIQATVVNVAILLENGKPLEANIVKDD